MSTNQRTLLIGGGLVVLLVAIIAIVWGVSSGDDDVAGKDDPAQSTTAGAEETETAPAEEPSDEPGEEPSQGASEPATSEGPEVVAPAGAVDEYGFGVGDPDAPVTVEVFEDYQCPHCAHFQEVAQGDLTAAAADGSAYVVYRPIAFINEYSARAMNAVAVVLDASGPEVAARFHELLYDNQPSGTLPSDDQLVALAVQAGANADQVRAGIESGEFAPWVRAASDQAFADGVNSTPTVKVNGTVVEGQSIEELAANMLSAIQAG